MLLLLFFIAALAVLAYGLEWVIDQPGSLSLDWGGYHVDTSIPVAVGVVIASLAAIIVVWAAIMLLLRMPSRLTHAGRQRRREKGFRALSHGIIAAAAGDAARAKKSASVAAKYLQNEPLTQLLKAQAAQLSGDRRGAEAAFHEMTLNPETKLLGLRGLHIEAQRRNDVEAAHLFASTAHEIAPLPWAGSALLEHHATQADWEKVRASIESNLKAKSIDLATAQRLRAVIETALAMEKQESDPIEALGLARLALKRTPDFTPAAALAARLMSRMGDKRKAIKLIEGAWAKNPHPDLADAFLEAAPGESNTERLSRVAKLAQVAPTAPESRRLLAKAALAARDFHLARRALTPLVEDDAKPTAKTCLLMAELEDAENGASGLVREWLARASHAPRDPVWIADGVISKRWAPVSPVTGRIDAFEWKSPPEHTTGTTEDIRAAIPAAFLAPSNVPEAISGPLDGG